jgi:uncharacterized protein (TIGR02444 family)
MTESRPDLEADSWAFALHIYAQPGVADACLNLQEAAGVDVMMLLMSAFVATRHRILLTASDIREMDHACSPWREQIIQPLRAVRKGLKSGPPPAPTSETEQFRSKIKLAELAAERLQNRLMAECLPLRPAKHEKVDREEIRSVLRSMVEFALQKRGSTDISSLLPSIEVIADAAVQDAT